MSSPYITTLMNLISKSKYQLIILSIFIIYHIIIAYISTFQLNISLIDRIEFHIYMLLQDPIKTVFQLLIPIGIAIYLILNICSSAKTKLSVPLVATLASGVSCIGCTLPLIAGAGILSSMFGTFISLLVPISFLIIVYSIIKKIDEMGVYNRYCQ